MIKIRLYVVKELDGENGVGRFGSNSLVLAAADGGYEQQPDLAVGIDFEVESC